MFFDMELIGIPHMIVVGERGMDDGVVEYKNRREGEKVSIEIGKVVEFIKSQQK